MHYHFIGINGVSMRALAYILYNKGYIVSGSDIQDSLDKNIDFNIKYIKFTEKLPETVNIVVYNCSTLDNNSHLIEAKQRNLQLINRAQLLHDITNDKFKIAVSGTSGKTSTTCYISTLMTESGLHPSTLVGTYEFENSTKSYQIDTGPWVLELHEGDMRDCIDQANCLVLNISGDDHIWQFKSLKDFHNHYILFAKRVKNHIYVNGDDLVFRELFKDINREKLILIGYSQINNWQIININETQKGVDFSIKYNNIIYNIKTFLHGSHSAYNITASIALIHTEFGITIQELIKYVLKLRHSFDRQQIRYIGKNNNNNNNIMICYDNLTHDTELDTYLTVFKKFVKEGEKTYLIFDFLRNIRIEMFKDRIINVIKKHFPYLNNNDSNIYIASPYIELKNSLPNTIVIKNSEDIHNFLNNVNGVCFVAACLRVKFPKESIENWIKLNTN